MVHVTEVIQDIDLSVDNDVNLLGEDTHAKNFLCHIKVGVGHRSALGWVAKMRKGENKKRSTITSVKVERRKGAEVDRPSLLLL